MKSIWGAIMIPATTQSRRETGPRIIVICNGGRNSGPWLAVLGVYSRREELSNYQNNEGIPRDHGCLMFIQSPRLAKRALRPTVSHMFVGGELEDIGPSAQRGRLVTP